MVLSARCSPASRGFVLIAGGSGITFALAALEDLVQKDTAGESRVKIIELVWVVADPGTSLLIFLSLLSQTYLSITRSPPPALRRPSSSSPCIPRCASAYSTRAPRRGKQPAFFDRASAPPVSEAPLSAPPTRPARPPPLDLGESEAAPLRRPGERTTAPPRRTGSRNAALVRAGSGPGAKNNATSPTVAAPSHALP